MNVLLRLGCALLACAGIAVARTPVGSADEAAAARRAQEQRAAPVLDEARDLSISPSSEEASVRPARRARPESRRSVPVAASGSAGRSPIASAPSVPVFGPRSAPFRALRGASPRGPPASA